MMFLHRIDTAVLKRFQNGDAIARRMLPQQEAPLVVSCNGALALRRL
jgi:hypothetical protein